MTDAELTILSLLAEAPRYGHEIQQLIEDRGLREWISVGFSSVFYILNKLEKQQMISAELRPAKNNPPRKYYQITEAGQGILQTRIADLLRAPRAFGSGFELGLANLHILQPIQVYRTLTHHYSDLQYQYEVIKQSWEQQLKENNLEHHIRALYTHSITIMEADLAWLGDFLEDWQKRHPELEEELANHPRTETTKPKDESATVKIIPHFKRPKLDDN